ncbi:hypothetical protein [Schwartzia succinivorans]|jgi:hemoglobin-like flavoprotein|nr:hypothetical protein [Schwartzia succinivorans]
MSEEKFMEILLQVFRLKTQEEVTEAWREAYKEEWRKYPKETTQCN